MGRRRSGGCLYAVIFFIALAISIALLAVMLSSVRSTEGGTLLTEILDRAGLGSGRDEPGGTLDNPVVIVNPYGLSPLSALIQFDTETAEPVTVIVKGKQPQTDLTWTYEPSTSHCLPIIGLYPEQKTTVQLIVDDMVKELEIEGQALPEDAFRAEVTVADQNPQPNQLIFTTPSSTGYATAGQSLLPDGISDDGFTGSYRRGRQCAGRISS